MCLKSLAEKEDEDDDDYDDNDDNVAVDFDG